MKLPENQTERYKLYAVIGIFAACGLYLGFSFGLKPLIEKTKQKTARIEQLEDLIWKAERALNDVSKRRRRNADAVGAILAQTDRKQFVIGHNLGNYLLVARGILEAYADAANVQLTSVEELTTVTRTPAAAPAKKGAEPDPNLPRFSAYRVGVAFSASLPDITRFLTHLHDQNPLLCITTITVDANPDNPLRHAVTMELEWPRWRTDDERMKLTENAAESYLMQLEESDKEARP